MRLAHVLPSRHRTRLAASRADPFICLAALRASTRSTAPTLQVTPNLWPEREHWHWLVVMHETILTYLTQAREFQTKTHFSVDSRPLCCSGCSKSFTHACHAFADMRVADLPKELGGLDKSGNKAVLVVHFAKVCLSRRRVLQLLVKALAVEGKSSCGRAISGVRKSERWKNHAENEKQKSE